MSEQLNQNNKPHIKLGHFTVKSKVNDTVEFVKVYPPTQQEYSEGWRVVLPRKTKKSYIHHFNIYLSQLPPHLWRNVRSVNKNEETYNTITERIYTYTVKKSPSDKKLFELYEQLEKPSPSLDVVSSLYKELMESSVKGWIMFKARRLLKLATVSENEESV